jgi:glutaredoxin
MDRKMKFVRWILGRLILTIDFLTRPTPIKRRSEDQALVDAKTAKMALYQFEACPFCVKVRRVMRKNALHIELRNAKIDGAYKEELIREGGKHKVPCLRIEDDNKNVKWLYESDAVNAFLKEEFKLS